MKLKRAQVFHINLNDLFREKTSENIFNAYNGINGKSNLNDLRMSIDPYGLVQFGMTLEHGYNIRTAAVTRLNAYKNIEEIIHAIAVELNLPNWDKLLGRLQSAKMVVEDTKEWTPTM